MTITQTRRTIAHQYGPGPAGRRAGTALMRDHLKGVWQAATEGPGHAMPHGAALGVVGSLGRGDLGPLSDLDVILCYEPDATTPATVSMLADRLWYPLWDAGVALDHSVRTVTECRQIASKDVPAAVGLLDLTHVAGDPSITARARAALLADWRGAARRRLPELLAAIADRAERFGEIADLLEPDLKEGRGGLRDALVLGALAGSWLVDRPHGEVDEAYQWLLDVRDAVQLITDRPAAKLYLADQDDVCALLGPPLADADDLLASVAQAGRTIAFALDRTTRGARQALRRPPVGRRAVLVRGRRTGPRLRTLAPGLVDNDGEIVLAAGMDPTTDPVLPWRAAATAARTGLPLSPIVVDSLAHSPAPAPDAPWPPEALGLFVAALRAGRGLVPIWAILDAAGTFVRWLPPWAQIRNRPQRTPVHRHTVDRHLIETVAHLAPFAPMTDRADLLLVAGLLHDIGKVPGESHHPERGAEIAGPLLVRMGLPPADARTVVLLIRHHLLLVEAATTADADDPATVDAVLDALADGEPLRNAIERVQLLRALTEADARAAGPAAWTTWRATLVTALTDRLLARLPAES